MAEAAVAAAETPEMGEKGTVCVTGAGGYIASWLVKLLLSRGYRVHGTVRDPSDEKNAHLTKLDKASENLRLFKADLLDCSSLLPAIEGCEGVFHTASPVPSSKVVNPEVEVTAPAVMGTLNVLKACSELKVRRVIVVSSTASVVLNPHWPHDKTMDENCWSDKDYCRTNENWYCFSKTMAEEEALNYGKASGLDVVTVLPSMVLGPLLQSTINASSLFLINLLKGNSETIEDQLRYLVDVRDVAEALILAYEKPEASGRYICSSHPMKMQAFVDKLKSLYPNYKYPKNFTEEESREGVSSDKLKSLGWMHRTIEETITDSVKCFQECGFLEEL